MNRGTLDGLLSVLGWKPENGDNYTMMDGDLQHQIMIDVIEHTAFIGTCHTNSAEMQDVKITHPRWRPVLQWVLDHEPWMLNHDEYDTHPTAAADRTEGV